MTATPVSMHEMDHHSLEDTAWVIQSHILAMYVPSLFSGFLVSWFGVYRIITVGAVLMLGVVLCCVRRAPVNTLLGSHGFAGYRLEFSVCRWNNLVNNQLSGRRKDSRCRRSMIFFSSACRLLGSLGAGCAARAVWLEQYPVAVPALAGYASSFVVVSQWRGSQIERFLPPELVRYWFPIKLQLAACQKVRWRRL